MNETSEGGWSVLVGASNEDDLIARSRLGDTTSFVGLVQTHDAYLRRVTFNLLGKPELMDSVLHEVYLEVFEALRNDTDEAPFGDWLFGQVFAACEKARHDHTKTKVDSADNDTQSQLNIMPSDEVAALSMVTGENVSIERTAQLFDTSKKDMAATIASARAVLGEDDETADEAILLHRTPRHDGDFWTTINRSFGDVEVEHEQLEAHTNANAPAPTKRRWLGRTTTTLAVTAASLLVVVGLSFALLGRV